MQNAIKRPQKPQKPIPFTPAALTRVNQITMMILIYIDLSEKEFVEMEHICAVFGQDRYSVKQWLEGIRKNIQNFHDDVLKRFGHIPIQLEQFGEMCDDRELQVKMVMYQKLKNDLGL